MLEELLDNFIRNSEILKNSDYVRDFVIKLHKAYSVAYANLQDVEEAITDE